MLKFLVSRGLPLAVIVFVASAAMWSCSDGVSSDYAGILEVDSAGNVVGGDSTDWTFGRAGIDNFTFGPATPNPSGGGVISTVADNAFVAGIHAISVADPGSPGIYRVTFESSLGTSYGDIEFK